MTIVPWRGLFPGLLSLFLLGGCDSETPDAPAEIVRAIKPYTISNVIGGDQRLFSGRTEASTTTGLSFAVGGTVREVLVQQGERVTQHQVLARLDDTNSRLELEAARADLANANARLKEKAEDAKRKEELFAKGWVTNAAVDQSRSAYTVARGEVNVTASKLGQAQKRLADTAIKAPFDGVVASRSVEPFQEVAAAQTLFTLDGEGGLKVAISVPEALIGRVAIGLPATVAFNALPGVAVAGRITEIGSVAGAGNIFPVSITLDEAPQTARAGMTVEASLTLGGETAGEGYLVPLSAIVAGETERRGFVFVYDPATSTVKRTPVEATGVRENLIGVHGVALGDIIAVAGASFLTDGKTVKLLPPDAY